MKLDQACLAACVVLGLPFAACQQRANDISLSQADAAVDRAGAGGDASGDAPEGGVTCVRGGTTALFPITVACAQVTPARVVTDNDFVYWTVQGGGAVVMKAPVAGGAPEPLVFDSAEAVGLAVDRVFVYYTQRSVGRVMRVPIAGGQAVALATKLDSPLFLATDGASLYWTGGQTTGTGTVMKLALDQGAKPITLIDGQSRPRAIAVDGGYVYWTDFLDGTLLRTLDHIDATADGGARQATRLATGLNRPSDLAVRDGYAYLPDQPVLPDQPGRILRVPTTGGDVQCLATMTGTPFGIATDGISVYWSTLGDGAIFKTSVDKTTIDCLTVPPFAPGEADPHFLTVDPLAVYWGTWGHGGAIRKIAK
jgi:hypothetical protein